LSLNSTHPQPFKLLANLNETQVKFAPKMIGQSTIVVMETQVGGAHLAHPQLLLLEARGGHGVSVHILQEKTSHRYKQGKAGL